MSQDILRELVQAAVTGALLENWPFWVALLSATAISAAICAYGASLLSKRGETAAITRDMSEILRQLQETTKVSTETRTAIERVDWLEREWRAMRRQKLEQLLAAVYDLETWLERMQDKWLHGDDATHDPRAIEKVKLLSSLYFPELKEVSERAWTAHAEAYQFVLKEGRLAGDAKADGDTEGYESALNAFGEGWDGVYKKVRNAVAELEKEAAELMPIIAHA